MVESQLKLPLDKLEKSLLVNISTCLCFGKSEIHILTALWWLIAHMITKLATKPEVFLSFTISSQTKPTLPVAKISQSQVLASTTLTLQLLSVDNPATWQVITSTHSAVRSHQALCQQPTHPTKELKVSKETYTTTQTILVKRIHIHIKIKWSLMIHSNPTIPNIK
jgi:hypothetical protein